MEVDLSDKIIVDGPRGFFPLAGEMLFRSEPYPITRAMIEDFCRGTHNEEWQHWDEQACQAAGYRTVIAPGLFLPAMFPGAFWKHVEIRNIPNLLMPKIDGIRTLRPVYAGTQIVITAEVAQVEERKGKVSVTYQVEFTEPDHEDPTALAQYNVRYWD